MTQTNLAVFVQDRKGMSVEEFAKDSDDVSRKLEQNRQDSRLKREFSVEYCFKIIAAEHCFLGKGNVLGTTTKLRLQTLA